MDNPASSAPTPPAIRVLLVDDHPVVREMLSLRIAQEADLEICATVGDVAGALGAVESLRPDLAIIDINLPDGHGLELIKEMRARSKKLRILVFSMHDENLYGERVLRAGAEGYLMKSEPPERIIEAVRRVLAGRFALSADLAERLLQGAASRRPDAGSPLAALSDRELEVFELIGSGLGTKEIAHRLGRGIKTIDTYRLRIREKLGIASATELVARAARWLTERP